MHARLGQLIWWISLGIGMLLIALAAWSSLVSYHHGWWRHVVLEIAGAVAALAIGRATLYVLAGK